jgi:hypothetical protein
MLSTLLYQFVSLIIGKTSALVNDIKGLDDFELICFMVIKSEE